MPSCRRIFDLAVLILFKLPPAFALASLFQLFHHFFQNNIPSDTLFHYTCSLVPEGTLCPNYYGVLKSAWYIFSLPRLDKDWVCYPLSG